MKIPGYDAWRLQGPPEPACEWCNDTGWLDCMNCGGDGEVDDCGTECPACEGTGRVECENHDEPDGDFLYEQARDRRALAMTPAELTARGVRVKYIYAPDCDECGDTGWVYFSCGTPWRCKCQRKSRAALTTGENDD